MDQNRMPPVDRSGGSGPLRVTVLSRPGCTLCGPVIDTVARVCADEGDLAWTVVDIDAPGREALRAEWTDSVPVTLVDGTPIARYRLREQALRVALGR